MEESAHLVTFLDHPSLTVMFIGRQPAAGRMMDSTLALIDNESSVLIAIGRRDNDDFKES